MTSFPYKAAIREVVETALLTLALFLGVRLTLQNYRVEGFSMEPNLHTGQYILVDKISYRVSDPDRGDVVVIRFPLDPKRDFVKRIIALPGETIEIHDRRVFVDGHPLQEPYIRVPGTYRYEKRQVPENHFYVLGDNRDNSHDSHIWDWLPREYIIGKARLSYWPWQYAGVIDHPDVTLANALTAFVGASASVAYADGDLPLTDATAIE